MKTYATPFTTLLLTGSLLGASFTAGAGEHGDAHGDPMAKVTISSTEVADGIWMLTGQGGNMAVSIGEDGTFLIDDQFAPLHDKILAAITGLGGSQPKFLLNTHWHGDHTGGNEAMGEKGTIIVAHDNVRKRLTSDQFVKAFNMKSGPQPEAALPVITFNDTITFHWNGQTVEADHVGMAHTDSDSYVLFTEANVVHTGDLFFNGFYPFLDPDSQGSLAGVISGVNEILNRIDDETVVIPGHGPLGNKAQLTEYRDMLQTVYREVKSMKSQGKTLDEVIAAQPTKAFDKKWGGGIFTAEQWLGIIYPTI